MTTECKTVTSLIDEKQQSTWFRSMSMLICFHSYDLVQRISPSLI